MNKIAIYGAGGLGREVAQLINQINAKAPEWNLLGFYDDNLPKGELVGGLPVLGDIDLLNATEEVVAIVVAIADSNIRESIVQQIDNSRVYYPILIHPSVIWDEKVTDVGEGSFITAGTIITTDVAIGRHSIINLDTTIGHDVVIGDYGSVMPGVHLSGNIKVGKGVLIGTGARVLQNLTIGDGAKVGAGAVVTKNVNEQTIVVGVPAKELKKS